MAGWEAERRRLLGLMVGPWLAEAVAAAVRLGVVDRIGDGPADAGELADVLGAAPDPLLRLLRMLAAVGVLEEHRGRFWLTPTGELLHSEHRSSMRDLALLYNSDLFLGAWRGLDEAVRTGDQAFRNVYGRDVYAHLAANPADAARFDAGMAAGSALAGDLAGAYDFSQADRVADIGGGDGSRLAELLEKHPRLHGTLQERPQVLAGARERLAPFVDEGRCALVGADFLREVPAEADVFLLCRVLHNWDDASCARILANCAGAMEAGSRLLIVERIMPENGRPPLSLAFDLHMMIMTGGRERTAGEYAALLNPAGLQTRRVGDLAGELRVLVAEPL